METISKAQLDSEYLIYKDLTPDKPCKTYLAMKEHSSGSPYFVILKEMDEKSSLVYYHLSKMWNPYLADTYELFRISDSANPELSQYIAVTEYVIADGSPDEECLSLTQFVRKYGLLSEAAALSVCIQICKGLNEFHKKGFVHRDLKPDNIMISRYDKEHPQIKIVDFGGAKLQSSDAHADTTVIGTLGYQAPESISSHVTNRSDIFAIGCILNFLLTGYEPGIYPYESNHFIVHIIEKATCLDPFYRYHNVASLQKVLEHELRTTAWDKIPVLRSLPGFRTHTLWKQLFSVLYYNAIFLFLMAALLTISVNYFATVLIFHLIGPLIIVCNMGNLLRFFPKKLRCNTQLFAIMRCIILVLFIMIPFISYS